MFAITLGDVALVDDVAAGLTLGCPPSATLRDSMLSRMARLFLRTLVCCYFLAAVARTVPCVDSARLVAALTIISASDMDGAEQCTGYNFPTAVVNP